MWGLDPSGVEEEAEAAAARGDDCWSECRRAPRRFAFRAYAGRTAHIGPVTVPRADWGTARVCVPTLTPPLPQERL
jgi:hypothetical protein